MALSAKSKSSEHPPMRLSVEMSPAAYQAILALLENAPTPVDELLEAFENRLSGVLLEALTEVAGVTPSDEALLQEVEVELRVVQYSSEAAVNADIDEEDEPDPVEGFRQAWHDAMTGNTHPASILWDDNFWDSPDTE
jgi:hypothetical protein